MAIGDRVGDALEATDTEGVDLDLVRQAADAVGGGDVRGARQLLQSAIGAGPVAGTAVPQPIRESSGKPGAPAYAVGAEPGTTVVLDEYRPGQGLNGGELVLLVLSVAAIAGGLLLAWRLRPADTVRQLRRADATVREACWPRRWAIALRRPRPGRGGRAGCCTRWTSGGHRRPALPGA